MKYSYVKSLEKDYKDVMEDFKWSIKDWVNNHRDGAYSSYVNVIVDNPRVFVTLTVGMSAEELQEFMETFNLTLSMKETIKVENISEEYTQYQIGTSKRVRYTFK